MGEWVVWLVEIIGGGEGARWGRRLEEEFLLNGFEVSDDVLELVTDALGEEEGCRSQWTVGHFVEDPL